MTCPAPVRTKADMYKRLTAGEFGNTIPQFFSVDEWLAHPDSSKYWFWGVRSATVSAHPACRLYCPRDEVADYANSNFPGSANISMMIDAECGINAWLEVWDSPTGLVVESVPYPDVKAGWNWRNSMRDTQRRKSWERSAAYTVLRTLLNADSFDDVMDLRDRYPDHVIELSAVDRCIGNVPMQNHVIWEVRAY